MTAPEFSVIPASWPRDALALRSVRETVFIEEQQIPPEEEWDALDPPSHHLLALDRNGCPIGCARLTPERRIGRMAVLKAWRGKGVGMALLQQAIAEARALGWREVELSAQEYAIGFYERAGFAAYGERYLDAGIPHRMMRMALVLPPDAPLLRPADDPDAEALRATDAATLAAAALRIITDARHGFALHTPDLEPDLFEQPALLEAIRRLAVRGRGTQVRILVQDPEPALRNGHRLLALIQRLPSILLVRQPVEEADRQYAGAFLINDRGGYLQRTVASRPQAHGSTHAPGPCAQLAGYFEQVWNRAQPVQGLHPLQI